MLGIHITQVVRGIRPSDLCLFKRDLYRGPYSIIPNSLYMIIRTAVAYGLLLLRPTVGFSLREDQVEEHRDDC